MRARNGPSAGLALGPAVNRSAAFNEDFRDFLDSLIAADARFLVVGAHALAAHGVPEGLGVSRADLEIPDLVIQIGQPPRRIDILTGLSGVGFVEAWPDRLTIVVDGLRVPFLGRAALSANKRASRRAKDLADLEALGEPRPGE